jgi:hypothetical protein
MVKKRSKKNGNKPVTMDDLKKIIEEKGTVIRRR